MIEDNIRDKFKRIAIWKRGEERAVHKPLLLLLALGKCSRNEPRLISYAEIERKLKDLLIEFGPFRKTIHTIPPFWRLKNDGIWEIPKEKFIQPNSSGDPSKEDLLNNEVSGGFEKAIFEKLTSDNDLLYKIVQDIIQEHFPETVHEDILEAIGLNLEKEISVRKKRDPDFRNRIVTIYGYKCAVCGFDVRLANNPICLEAAHIKWHQAGGPANEKNGVALCSMHHKMFDRGIFTLSNDYRILVSESANGSCGLKEWLLNFQNKKIFVPSSEEYLPKEQYIQWHVKEVFKGTFRAVPKSESRLK